MKRIIFICVLMSINVAIAGEWDFVELSDNFQIITEKDTREVNGDFVKEWSTISWLGKQSIILNGSKLKSVRVWNQYDCEKRKAKRLYSIGYVEPLAKGNQTYINVNVSTWQNLPKDSMIESMWNEACRG